MSTEQLSSKQLQEKLRLVLEAWPLYRQLSYAGADEIKAVPECLSMFCNSCDKETFWQTPISVKFYHHSDEENNKTGFTEKTYSCRNCGLQQVTYYFYWKAQNNNTSLFFKVGQYPELEERVSSSLEDALNSEDLKMYKNALRLRNFNLGIAAVAYMRRVVENRMNDILGVLHEAARVHNAPAEILARHQEIERDRPFSVKVDYAGDLLPANLRPQGHPNPLQRRPPHQV